MTSKTTTPSSAVSDAVNDLIRAAIGGEARSIGDDDLDKYVADLILKESEAKRKKYDNVGVSAYLPNTPPSNLPRPNKRFLLNMVKATDSHNQALREQEEQRSRHQQRRKRYRDDDDDDDDDRRQRRRQRETKRRMDDDNDRQSSDNERDIVRRQQRRTSSLSRRENPRQQKPAKDDRPSSPAVTVRGRGAVKRGTAQSKMDKYFDKRYDPLMDVEPDLDQMVYTEFPIEEEEEASYPRKEKKKKKKKEKTSDKKKKSSKKRKRNDEDDDEGVSSGDDRHHHHRSRHHHRKKNRRHEDDSNSSENSDDKVVVEEPKPVRAWDIGKQSSR